MQSAREEIRDLERIKYVTENFERLQGLRYIPFVLPLVLWGFATWLWFEEPSGFFDFQPLRNGAFFLVMLTPWIFVGPIERYYENRFGLVRQRRRKPTRRGALLLATALVVTLVVGSLALRDNLGQPVLGIVGGLFAAAFILYNWWPVRSRFTLYWTALSMLAIVVCSLPLAGVFVGEMFSLLTAPLGAIFVTGLVMDHLLLVRTLKTVPGEDDGRAV